MGAASLPDDICQSRHSPSQLWLIMFNIVHYISGRKGQRAFTKVSGTRWRCNRVVAAPSVGIFLVQDAPWMPIWQIRNQQLENEAERGLGRLTHAKPDAGKGQIKVGLDFDCPQNVAKWRNNAPKERQCNGWIGRRAHAARVFLRACLTLI